MDGSKLIVRFPDIKISSFIAMLKVIYCGSTLTAEELKESDTLLSIANEFKVPSLLEKLGRFFKEGVQPANACALYDRLAKVDPLVAQQVGDFIRPRAIAVVETDGFLDLSPEGLKNLLKMDLFIDEINLWKRIIVWAQKQTILRSLEPSNKEHMSQVLTDILPLIRFPTMTVGQLAEVSAAGIVPGDHLVQIFTFVGSSKKDGSKWNLPYSLLPRKT